MTSGGTESLLLTIKTYRDRARALFPHIEKPEAIMCRTVHVAVPKGQHREKERRGQRNADLADTDVRCHCRLACE